MIKIAIPQINKAEQKAVLNVLKSGYIVNGPKTKEFEENFSRYIGTKYAVAASSGTSALHTVLQCLGLKKNDAAVTTPFSFIATSNAILFCGAKTVFCDIDPLTFNIDPEELKKTIKKTPSLKAVVCVHLFGLPCYIKEIKHICKKNGLLLIEDCAQAHGSEYKNKKTGSFGDGAIFSFYATKNMTTGEGGIITTNSKSLAEKCRRFINHGRISHNQFSMLGFNYRLTDIASGIGLEQLKKLDLMNSKRIENAGFLNKHLDSLKNITTPFTPEGYKNTFHQYVIRVKKDRTALKEYLFKNGIESAVFYSTPIYRQIVYKKLGYQNIYLKNTELACREVLSLPVHPSLTKNDLSKIAGVIKAWKK